MARTTGTWECPVCDGRESQTAFRAPTRTHGAVEAMDLTPAAIRFGATIDTVVRCARCRHGSLATTPSSEMLQHAYGSVEDAESILEEDSQVATSHRDLLEVAIHLRGKKRSLLDVGCWTGSLLTAAQDLGWNGRGVDPSSWATGRATARGLRVSVGTLDDVCDSSGPFQVITCCDVLEHLVDPGASVDRIKALLEPGGMLFATVPDAGSLLARVLGRRWWSVLPMHVQYFTRDSLRRLIEDRGFEIVTMHSHPKVFSRRYYAERFGEFVPVIGPILARLVNQSAGRDRPLAPDFRDRVAVIARLADSPRPEVG